MPTDDQGKHRLVEVMVLSIGEIRGGIPLDEEPDVDRVPDDRREFLNSGAQFRPIDFAELIRGNRWCGKTGRGGNAPSRVQDVFVDTGDENRTNGLDVTNAPDSIRVGGISRFAFFQTWDSPKVISINRRTTLIVYLRDTCKVEF